MAQTSPSTLLVIDTNVIISLIQAGELNVLSKLHEYKPAVPDEVVQEVIRIEQIPALMEALDNGVLTQESATSIAELDLFSEYIIHMGRGEAACLAIAVNRHCYLASDEKRKFRRLAIAAIGENRILTLEELRKLMNS